MLKLTEGQFIIIIINEYKKHIIIIWKDNSLICGGKKKPVKMFKFAVEKSLKAHGHPC
jgi:hypothetical protein